MIEHLRAAMKRGRPASVLLALFLAGCSPASAEPTLDDLWSNKAHFAQVREMPFGQTGNGGQLETATWYVVRNGTWYAFSRADHPRPAAVCPTNHMKVVVRESGDKGATWSAPVDVARPGDSGGGDGCAVLDGSSFYDSESGTWHLLAQCLDNLHKGGWSLCHYTRRAVSPLGAFVADPANPVVRGGQLWSTLCGSGKSCPSGVLDEGTPDIVAKQGGMFLVTMHGYDPASERGYRGVVATPDFRRWATSGPGLPGANVLGPQDCAKWLSACVGFGQASSVLANGRIYVIAESMDRSLVCVPNQEWVFAIMRSTGQGWPRGGSGGWQRLPNNALVRRNWPDAKTPCALSYARWIVDGPEIYLTYEDWEPNHARMHRRLLKLMPGDGPAISFR